MRCLLELAQFGDGGKVVLYVPDSLLQVASPAQLEWGPPP